MTCFFPFSLAAFMSYFPSGAAWDPATTSSPTAHCAISDIPFFFSSNKQTEKLQILSLLFISKLSTQKLCGHRRLLRHGGGEEGGGAAKCEAACRAKSRQALCKANTASRRLVLVSGRLVSLALFIVSATRHLLETRLCPPVSTQHRTEGACQHYPPTPPPHPSPPSLSEAKCFFFFAVRGAAASSNRTGGCPLGLSLLRMLGPPLIGDTAGWRTTLQFVTAAAAVDVHSM